MSAPKPSVQAGADRYRQTHGKQTTAEPPKPTTTYDVGKAIVDRKRKERAEVAERAAERRAKRRETLLAAGMTEQAADDFINSTPNT